MQRLEVHNLALIDSLELELKNGFNVFTGETGAGKSIIVDAIWLLTGARADTELIRSGAESLVVTGFWDEVMLSRRIQANGRSVARVDGEVVSNRELSENAAKMVTVHWQHAAQALLDSKYHRDFLDAALPDQAILEDYRQTFSLYSEQHAKFERLVQSERERTRRMDLLQYQLREIEEADPKPDEEEPLRFERERLLNAERIAKDAGHALLALDEDEQNATGLIADALKFLSSAGRFDARAAQLTAELREALSSVQAIVGEVRDLTERAAADPEALDEIENRLAMLEKLKNKYGASLADVLEYAQKLRLEINELSQVEDDLAQLQLQLEVLKTQLQTRAATLTQARTEAATRIAPELVAVIQNLGMPSARLEFRLLPCELSQHGAEDIEIRFSANRGEELGDLSKIASGGELSRVMLALSTVLGANTPTVIFDEVDAGIGGQAALAVAKELQKLAQTHQVLVVTHLAQIAAKADHHYKVEKLEQDGRTVTRVRLLDFEARVLELARMLSGTDSSTAIAHARELLG
ncbi:MAG: DNA repair protein RecN [Deinococcales bacterium]